MHAIVVVSLIGITFTLAASNYKFHLDSPSYEYGYKVFDAVKGQDFGHSQRKTFDRTDGVYYVLLPDGRKQTVKYYADDKGYFPMITYQQMPFGSHGNAEEIFNSQENNFGEFKHKNNFLQVKFPSKHPRTPSIVGFSPYKGEGPLEKGVGISTSNFDFHKNRKINTPNQVGSQLYGNKNSNAYGSLTLKPPVVAFTNFALSDLSSSNQRSNVNKNNFKPFNKPNSRLSFKPNFATFEKPLKTSILSTRIVPGEPVQKTFLNALYVKDNPFADQFSIEVPKPMESRENYNTKTNHSTDFTTVYVPSIENSVSGYFRPLTNGVANTNQFSKIYTASRFIKDLNDYDYTRSSVEIPEGSVVPAVVPVIYPVEGDLVETSRQNLLRSEQISDTEDFNDIEDYWDEDYL